MEIRELIQVDWGPYNIKDIKMYDDGYATYDFDIREEMEYRSDCIWVDDLVIAEKRKRLNSVYKSDGKIEEVGWEIFYISKDIISLVEYGLTDCFSGYNKISYEDWIIKGILE